MGSFFSLLVGDSVGSQLIRGLRPRSRTWFLRFGRGFLFSHVSHSILLIRAATQADTAQYNPVALDQA
jgi:hypothetical protein